MTGVDAEGGFEGFNEDGAVAFEMGAGLAVMEIGVAGMQLETFGVGTTGEGVIVLFQGQRTPGQVGLDQVGVGLAGRFEDAFEDDLGIRPQLEGGLGQGDDVPGIAKRDGIGGDKAADLVEETPGLIGVTGGKAGFTSEPAEAEAAGIGIEGVGEDGTGLGVTSDGEERLGEDVGPVFVPWIFRGAGGGELDGVGIVAGPDEFEGFGGFSGPKRGGEAGTEKEEEQEDAAEARPRKVVPATRAIPRRKFSDRSHCLEMAP